jgi:hypothetical protein
VDRLIDHEAVSFGTTVYDPSYGGEPFVGTNLALALIAWENRLLLAKVDDTGEHPKNRTCLIFNGVTIQEHLKN